MTSALAEPPWCVCSAYLGTPVVFPLSVMQLAALLGFPCWLTQVGCSTPAVMVSHGFGGCLVTVVLFPPCFLFCACAASPSAASPSGFCPLTEWVGMSVSSLLVYSLVWLEGSCCDFFLSACALFSLLQVHWDFLGFSCSACMLEWLGLCTLCQGVPVAVLSAWFAGGVPLLPFPYLRWVYFWLRCLQSLWATKAVSAALRGSSSSSGVCWSISFFWSWGGFWSRVGGSSCNSWFWSLLMLGHTFLTPSPLPLLPSMAVGWSWRLFFLALCLGFVLLAFRVGCWLGIIEVFP